MSDKLKILLSFFAIYVIWGITYIWMKIASQDLHPFAIIFWQNLIGSIVIISFNYTKSAISYFQENYLLLIQQSFLMLVFGVGLITVSVEKLPASLAATIICTVPLWVSLLELLRERTMSSQKILGIFLGFLGIVLLCKTEFAIEGKPTYVFLLLFAAFSWSVGIQRQPRLRKMNDPYLSSAWQMLIASIVYLLLYLAFIEDNRLVTSNPSTIFSIFSLAIFGDAIAFSSLIWLLKRVSSVKVSTYAYVNPIVSILMSWLLLNESLSRDQVLYASIIVVSVFITVSDFQGIFRLWNKLTGQKRI